MLSREFLAEYGRVETTKEQLARKLNTAQQRSVDSLDDMDDNTLKHLTKLPPEAGQLGVLIMTEYARTLCTENDARVASYTVTCTDQSNRSIDAGGAASTTFSSLSDGSYTVTVVAVPTDTDTYASSDAWTSSSIAIGTPSPSAIYTANFEGDSEHRTSGSNSYTSNSYTVSGVTWSLTKADCVTTGSPLAGSANIMCRVKGTSNNGSVVTGDVLKGVSKTVTELDYKSKLGTNVTITVSYSTDNSTWTSVDTYKNTTTADREVDISAIGSTDHLYLKFEYVTSDSGSTSTNRDSQLDNVVIMGY